LPDLTALILSVPDLLPMSFDFVLSILAAGYILAGLVLLTNLYRNGFLRGNLLGIGAALVFAATALTYLPQIFLESKGNWHWLEAVSAIIGFVAIYGFILLSLKNRFIIGGYRALEAARQQLRQQERWMQIMQENMTDGLAVFGRNGRLLYINPAALKLLNITDLAMRDHARIMFGLGYKTDIEADALIAQVLRGNDVSTRLVAAEGPNQGQIIEVRLSPVYSRLRKVIAVAASYRDVTQIHNLDRAKEEFIQIASHELRTPLTAVKGFISLLGMSRYGDMTKKQKQIVGKALASCVRLSKLVDNLLLVARIEESKSAYNPQLLDIDEIIKQVVQELAGEADRCGIKLMALPSARKLPPISGDREKMEQIITNLVGNAIKYTPEGGQVFIETRLKQGEIELKVIDTGVGIAESDLSKLFHKFQRIRNNRSVGVGGSGLGLVIVKSFAEMHGGRVSVNSIEGQGSTFTLILPAANSAA